MKLTKGQNRFINNKSMGITFLKGKKNSGKTTAAIYRAINLENNYCIYNDDKILYITLDNDNANSIRDKYNNIVTSLDKTIKVNTTSEVVTKGE